VGSCLDVSVYLYIYIYTALPAVTGLDVGNAELLAQRGVLPTVMALWEGLRHSELVAEMATKVSSISHLIVSLSRILTLCVCGTLVQAIKPLLELPVTLELLTNDPALAARLKDLLAFSLLEQGQINSTIQ